MDDRNKVSRRRLLQMMAAAGAAAPLASLFAPASALAQGACRDGYGTPRCPLDAKTATAPIPPVFEPTGWNTVSLNHITFSLADYKSEAAFYVALMGWTLRSDDGTQAVMDIGNWGTAVFKQRAAAPVPAAGAVPAAGGGGRGRGGASNATVESFGFDITPWNAKTVEAELKKRGLDPIADHDPSAKFESFHERGSRSRFSRRSR